MILLARMGFKVCDLLLNPAPHASWHCLTSLAQVMRHLHKSFHAAGTLNTLACLPSARRDTKGCVKTLIYSETGMRSDRRFSFSTKLSLANYVPLSISHGKTSCIRRHRRPWVLPDHVRGRNSRMHFVFLTSVPIDNRRGRGERQLNGFALEPT